jgi:hypothetical protein
MRCLHDENGSNVCGGVVPVRMHRPENRWTDLDKILCGRHVTGGHFKVVGLILNFHL